MHTIGKGNIAQTKLFLDLMLWHYVVKTKNANLFEGLHVCLGIGNAWQLKLYFCFSVNTGDSRTSTFVFQPAKGQPESVPVWNFCCCTLIMWMDRYANCTIYLLMMASLEFEFNFYLPRLASIFKWIFPHDFVQFQIHTEYKLNLNLQRDLSYVVF